jgi:hypothetical protein
LKFVDEMLREVKEYGITIIEFRSYERMNESFSSLEGEKFPDFSDVSKVIEERLAGVVNMRNH